ncbi:MAG: hypothetical protein ACYDA4_08615 [Ignavibacteriaceae bacterium]
MHHYVYHLTQIDHSVVKAIFHLLNSGAKNMVAVVPFEKKFQAFSNKIKANFINNKHDEVKNIFYSNWFNILCVEFFIRKHFKIYEQQVQAIIEKVRCNFKLLPANFQGKVDFPVNDPLYFEELSKLIIPKCRENDPRYMLTAKAIILFLFLNGKFGRTTPEDPPSIFNKLEKSP